MFCSKQAGQSGIKKWFASVMVLVLFSGWRGVPKCYTLKKQLQGLGDAAKIDTSSCESAVGAILSNPVCSLKENTTEVELRTGLCKHCVVSMCHGLCYLIVSCNCECQSASAVILAKFVCNIVHSKNGKNNKFIQRKCLVCCFVEAWSVHVIWTVVCVSSQNGNGLHWSKATL